MRTALALPAGKVRPPLKNSRPVAAHPQTCAQFETIEDGTDVAIDHGVLLRLLAALACVLLAAGEDPFSPVAPAVTLSIAQRAAIDHGEVLAFALPARRGQVAAFGATRVNADPESLARAARDIAALKKSRFVEAIHRFSDPPLLSDLDELHLNDRDRQALASCESGSCSFKLAAIEIETIKRLRYGDVNGERLTAALRRVLFDRVMAYRTAGLAALPPIANRGKPWRLHDVFSAMAAESPRLLQSPPLDAWMRDQPRPNGEIETFLYWSKEYYGAGKPVILLTEVAIYQPSRDAVIVAGKQLFSNRYMNGALSLMAITTDAGGARYLMYLNRTTVDLLGGLFGGIKRAMLESHVADEMPEIIATLRQRLERSRHVSSPDSLRHD